MIKSINEFSKEHKLAVIVNYDFSKIFDYGLVYRTSTDHVEKIRKNNGKYIQYPYIQQFKKGRDSKVEVFILYDGKMYLVDRINDDDNSNYKIVKEITNISPDLYKDGIFYENYFKATDAVIVNNEPLLKIIE